jgi:hypothetical protein
MGNKAEEGGRFQSSVRWKRVTGWKSIKWNPSVWMTGKGCQTLDICFMQFFDVVRFELFYIVLY